MKRNFFIILVVCMAMTACNKEKEPVHPGDLFSWNGYNLPEVVVDYFHAHEDEMALREGDTIRLTGWTTSDNVENAMRTYYINYWGQNMNMYTNEQDSVNIYLSASSNTEVEIVGTQYRFNIDSTKLGQEFGVTETKLFSKFKVEKRADGKLNITYKVIPNIGNSRKIEIEFTKCFDDCTPKINNSTVYYIYQNP